MKINKNVFVYHTLYTAPHRSSYKFNYPIGSKWWMIVQIVRGEFYELSKKEILDALQVVINEINFDEEDAVYECVSDSSTVFSQLTQAGLITYNSKTKGYDLGPNYFSYNESFKRTLEKFNYVNNF